MTHRLLFLILATLGLVGFNQVAADHWSSTGARRAGSLDTTGLSSARLSASGDRRPRRRIGSVG